METNKNTWFIFIREPMPISTTAPTNEGMHKPNKGKPIGCVCLVKNDNGTYNRGISICSKKDRFEKRIARQIAFSRATCGKNLTVKKLIHKTPVLDYIDDTLNTMAKQFRDYENIGIMPRFLAQTNLPFDTGLMPLERTTVSKEE